MTSGADGIGDCFWLEGLVQTIEGYGEVKWEKSPSGLFKAELPELD